MRYFLWLSYDGRDYHGWQVQPNGISVEEVVEQCLSTLLRKETDIVGAGRTDTGVHATGMVAHFDTAEPLADADSLLHRLDRMLPATISAYALRPVKPEAHARFSAIEREYRYHIILHKDPLLHHCAWQVPFPLDFTLMNEAAEVMRKYEDFTSFSKLHTDVKTNICHISHARWTQVADGHWCFTIRADRFLRNMVRAIVGTLLDVGRGKLSIDDMCRIIERKDRCAAGQSVPAHGLTLCEVAYPDHIFL